jgi:alpha-D-ribose 1-methylphosphonate 5-triphosphate synthase subunit PhnL
VATRLEAVDLHRRFKLLPHGGPVLSIFDGISLTVEEGECVALTGPSGCGKSTLLQCLYGSYRVHGGRIRVRHFGRLLELQDAPPSALVEVRRHTLGLVSPMRRVPPRSATLDVVAEPLAFSKAWPEEGRRRAAALLARLRLPEYLWSAPPATLSSGERQRVSLARGLVADHPVMLFDDPTASLDAANRATVIEMILEAKARGASIVLASHDDDARDRLADRLFRFPAPALTA